MVVQDEWEPRTEVGGDEIPNYGEYLIFCLMKLLIWGFRCVVVEVGESIVWVSMLITSIIACKGFKSTFGGFKAECCLGFMILY